MKNMQSIWFSSLPLIGQIGIVLGEDEVTGKRKAYIGVGLGVNEAVDEKLVVLNGDKFPAEIAEKIAQWLNQEQSNQIRKDGDSE